MCIHNWKYVLMLNWNVRMLKVKCAYAQLACTCSPESARMHNWKCAHAQLEVCTCSIGTCSCYLVELYMLNWHAHAHLKLCACTTGSVHMLNWKCAYAQLACTCSPQSVHAQLEACTCSTDIYIYIYILEACTCSTDIYMYIYIYIYVFRENVLLNLASFSLIELLLTIVIYV